MYQLFLPVLYLYIFTCLVPVTHENLPVKSESNRKLAWSATSLGLDRSSAASQGLRRSSAASPGLGRELSRAVWLLWDRGVRTLQLVLLRA